MSSPPAVGSRHASRNRTQVFWCASFDDVADGRITGGEEFWLTELAEPAPGWRAPYRL